METIKWGGSGIEKVVYDWIVNNIPKGSSIIELGAGHVSTQALSKEYNLYSIEHNLEYVNHYPNVNYIHAEMVDGWYDVNVLKGKLPPLQEQKMILIDGASRDGLLKNIKLFNKKATFIIHDTYRDAEIALANDLAKLLKRKAVFHTEGDYWATI